MANSFLRRWKQFFGGKASPPLAPVMPAVRIDPRPTPEEVRALVDIRNSSLPSLARAKIIQRFDLALPPDPRLLREEFAKATAVYLSDLRRRDPEEIFVNLAEMKIEGKLGDCCFMGPSTFQELLIFATREALRSGRASTVAASTERWRALVARSPVICREHLHELSRLGEAFFLRDPALAVDLWGCILDGVRVLVDEHQSPELKAQSHEAASKAAAALEQGVVGRAQFPDTEWRPEYFPHLLRSIWEGLTAGHPSFDRLGRLFLEEVAWRRQAGRPCHRVVSGLRFVGEPNPVMIALFWEVYREQEASGRLQALQYVAHSLWLNPKNTDWHRELFPKFFEFLADPRLEKEALGRLISSCEPDIWKPALKNHLSRHQRRGRELIQSFFDDWSGRERLYEHEEKAKVVFQDLLEKL